MIRTLLIAGLLGNVSTVMLAQTPGWGVTAEVGQSWFGGGARRDSAGVDDLQPSPSRYGSVRVDRSGKRVGLGLTLLYEKTGVRDATDGVDITFHDLATLYSARPEASVRALTLGAATVYVHVGAAVEYWQISGEDPRTRLGAIAGATLVVPLGGSFGFRLRWEGGLSPSIFKDSELPAAFEMRPSIHSRIGFGIRLGL